MRRQDDIERLIDALVPKDEDISDMPPWWWTTEDFGSWDLQSEQSKVDWWRWTARVDILSEALDQGRYEDRVRRSVPLRALGAYRKKNALDDYTGPGWRQDGRYPDTWEWPFRFKDYWNPLLRAELEALVALPDDKTPMSRNWVVAARNRLRLAKQRFEEAEAEEKARLRDLKRRDAERRERVDARVREQIARDLPENRIRRGQAGYLIAHRIDDIWNEFQRDDTE